MYTWSRGEIIKRGRKLKKRALRRQIIVLIVIAVLLVAGIVVYLLVPKKEKGPEFAPFGDNLYPVQQVKEGNQLIRVIASESQIDCGDFVQFAFEDCETFASRDIDYTASLENCELLIDDDLTTPACKAFISGDMSECEGSHYPELCRMIAQDLDCAPLTELACADFATIQDGRPYEDFDVPHDWIYQYAKCLAMQSEPALCRGVIIFGEEKCQQCLGE